MEYLGDEAITVKDFLYKLGNYTDPILEKLVDKISTAIATMHSGDSIHGDLTTSNMMIKPRLPVARQLSGDNKISVQEIVESGELGDLYLIDFGLSSVSAKIEDKGVDFYVLKRAFISTHPGSEDLFEKVLQQYRQKAKKGL